MNTVARGGTELMAARINTLPPELLQQCQIIHSRVREPLDSSKVRILVLHDLPEDPENDHLKNEGWKRFNKLVFVSHWQQEQYNIKLGIPYSAGIVLKNAIPPFTKTHEVSRNPDEINLVYFSTPHRGLNILEYVFRRIAKDYQNVYLNVYSSFDLYGWGQRDDDFKPVFDGLKANPKVRLHKSVSNEEMREVLLKSDILAYPCTWPETSCLVLIESMCAGLICVHPNFAALTETSMGLTHSYQYTDDVVDHVRIFDFYLRNAIENKIKMSPEIVAAIAQMEYNWNVRREQWIHFLTRV